MIIYLAGPMSGLPDSNYPAFNAAAAVLRSFDYTVLNPAENPHSSTWLGYMRMSLRQIASCDHACFLPGWEASKGACIEMELAKGLGIPVHFYDYKPAPTEPKKWFTSPGVRAGWTPAAPAAPVLASNHAGWELRMLLGWTPVSDVYQSKGDALDHLALWKGSYQGAEVQVFEALTGKG